MIRFHAMLLILCGVISFVGHYLQFGVARITPWIPTAVGSFVLLAHFRFKNKSGLVRLLPILPVFVFGFIVTLMCIKFLPQDFQPLRKKIIFSIMSISSWITVGFGIKELLKITKEKKK